MESDHLWPTREIDYENLSDEEMDVLRIALKYGIKRREVEAEYVSKVIELMKQEREELEQVDIGIAF